MAFAFALMHLIARNIWILALVVAAAFITVYVVNTMNDVSQAYHIIMTVTNGDLFESLNAGIEAGLH